MNNKGYTLLEVILTLAILSASMVGVIHAFVNIERSKVMAFRHSQALLLEDYKLHGLLQERYSSRTLSEGKFKAPFEMFRFKAAQGNESESGFREVDLTVSWTLQEQKKEVTLSTYARKRDGYEK